MLEHELEGFTTLSVRKKKSGEARKAGGEECRVKRYITTWWNFERDSKKKKTGGNERDQKSTIGGII